MYLVETSKKDLKATVYNNSYILLKEELQSFSEVTEPYEYDPDGYFEVSKNNKVIGVAFVLDSLAPLAFRIQFEKEYGKPIPPKAVCEELYSIISSAIYKLFSKYQLKDISNEIRCD